MARKKVVKAPKVDPLVSYVKVDYDSYVDTFEELGQERDCTAKTTTINGIKDVGKDGYYDLTVPFKLEQDVEYYLVYINYDTGDSFGWDRGQICYIELFKSRELAKKLTDAIYENAMSDRIVREARFHTFKKGEKRPEAAPTQLEYERDDGSKTVCYTGTWRGYFDRFTYVEAQVVETEQKYRRSA